MNIMNTKSPIMDPWETTTFMDLAPGHIPLMAAKRMLNVSLHFLI